MKQVIITQDNNKLIPYFVWEALNDKDEITHIRHLQSKVFFIVNYPYAFNRIFPVAIELDNGNYTIFHTQSDIQIELNGIHIISDLLHDIIKRYSKQFRDARSRITTIQESVDKGINKAQITQLFELNDSLIYLEVIVTALQDVLEYTLTTFFDDADVDERINLNIEASQLVKNIDLSIARIDALLSVADSLHSGKLNDIMTRLALYTLMLSIPTFITSFYGMNVPLPAQTNPYSYLFILGSAGITTAAVILYLKLSKRI